MPLFNFSPGQYRGAVRFFNTNAMNGKLRPISLSSVLIKHGIQATADQLRDMIEAISVDSEGIDLQGFLDYVATYTQYRDNDQEYAECFRIFDKDASGTLSRTEIKYVMDKIGNSRIDIDGLLDQVDKNKDGVIDYEEFVALMKLC